jgi:hypothetical protein
MAVETVCMPEAGELPDVESVDMTDTLGAKSESTMRKVGKFIFRTETKKKNV